MFVSLLSTRSPDNTVAAGRQGFDQRRFAGAVDAEQANPIAGRQIERNVAQNDMLIVADRHIGEAQQVLRLFLRFYEVKLER